jgi:hypothetical protein
MAKVTPAAEAEAETETKYGRGYFTIEQPPSWVPACVRLIGQRVDDTIVVPGLYLRASNELISVALLICWAITALARPDVIANNQLKNYVGYNNPCVGWDMPPAQYVGLLIAVLMSHLAWAYAGLDAARTQLRDDDGRVSPKEAMCLVADYAFALSQTVFCLLFVVGPPDDAWGWHTFIFVQFIFCRYLVNLANYFEAPPAVRRREHKAFIIVYGVVSLVLPLLYLVNITVYEAKGRTGVDPVLPWWITCVVDYAWVACSAFSTRMLPPDVPLRVTREVMVAGAPHALASRERAALAKLGLKAKDG